MKWHLVDTDKTFLHCKGFEKIPTDNRDIGQRSSGTGGNMEPIASWNQLGTNWISNPSIFVLKEGIMEKSQYI